MGLASLGRRQVLGLVTSAGLVLAGLAGCPSASLIVRHATRASFPRHARWMVEPPVFMDRESDAADSADAFASGLVVGHILSTQGIVFDERLGASRSKTVEISQVDRYHGVVTEAVGEALGAWVGLLGGDHVARPSGTPPAATCLLAPDTPLFTEGADNVNVATPRVRCVPHPNSVTSAADFVITPVVLYGYSHNASWFVGQQWGCGGGARVRVAFAVVDVAQQRIVAEFDLDAAARHDDVRQPDRYLAERWLRDALAAWRGTLLRDLP